ncbi:MAG: SusC/RagA family TonB-linked outer membrane protein [Bacteroidaceae bacterium]|nr:SusC/RagA family TonB-linked outer membrane protein [Bacteroidaceae bacterium]
MLDRIFYEEAGLDYEIVNGAIVLKKATGNRPYFKRIIIGVVTDVNDEPLPGAAVQVEGTSTGVITDLEGMFSLTVEGSMPTLKISYVGMKTQRVRLSSRTTKKVYVKLEADTKLLEDIIVTGYQNIKRENATGSYQLISAQDLDRRYTGDVVSNLEGMVPGLVRYNNGFNDGGESALTIRGTGSFNATTNPLVVVDGLPIEGGLESVNPYNIENITVLKDAAAASIYGARASNGVIVITTKRAKSDKLEVGFSADLTISEKNDYDYLKWANAEELIKLERYNFNFVKNNPSQSAWQNIQNYYADNPYALSSIVRLLAAKELGQLTTEALNSQLEQLSRNDYRKEWQDVWERLQVIQQYNLALRNRGKYINSSLVINFKNDNQGVVKEHDRTLTFSYRGDMNPAEWLALEFGANVVNQRSKRHISSEWNSINSFAPYQSMYNADGSLAGMEAGAWLNEPSLLNNAYGLKSEAYNLNDEVNRNFTNGRHTNIRSFIHAKATLLEGWTVGGMFQYEDIYEKSNAYREAESYDMRHLYNLYTSPDGTHNLPDGGELTTRTGEGAYYTFRAQTDFTRTFAQRHLVEAIAGFEFRQSQFNSHNTLLMGYDEQSQTNNMGTVNIGQLMALEGSTSALGPFHSMFGAPTGADYTTSDVLHRFYSVYFNGNYTYDSRYSASVSYRVDKADLFGADPKFRGRPLWSIGAGWNMHNESFMKGIEWIDALKLRASYGLTGNIAQDFSSYLTATVGVNELNGVRVAQLDTPPNEQLRWEKTASFNIGTDFALFGGRVTGALDYYRKAGSDLLTTTDLDPTTGWSMLTINNGKMINRGVELQLNGEIIRPGNTKQLGLNVDFNIAYNHNEVTSVNHEIATGAEALAVYTLHKGYPVHSLFSYRFAGMKEIDGIQYFGWYDANDKVHYADINTEEFTPADAVYSGSLDPKVTASLVPQLSWQGFTLSAMFAFYGGHVMRARVDDWTYEGSPYGYNSLSEIEAVPRSYLNYWTSAGNQHPANGYAGSTNVVGNSRYIDANVVPADYIKLRNLVLGYDFPQSICRQLSLQSLRLRIQANNLLTWTRNDLGVDPESCTPTGGEIGLKAPRSYTMSLNVNF